MGGGKLEVKLLEPPLPAALVRGVNPKPNSPSELNQRGSMVGDIGRRSNILGVGEGWDSVEAVGVEWFLEMGSACE